MPTKIKSVSANWKAGADAEANRGEVWLVDLEMVAKARPRLVIGIPTNARTLRQGSVRQTLHNQQR